MEVTALSHTTDISQNPVLLVGMIDGTIQFFHLPDFQPLLVITKGSWGHSDSINEIMPGPGVVCLYTLRICFHPFSYSRIFHILHCKLGSENERVSNQERSEE